MLQYPNYYFRNCLLRVSDIKDRYEVQVAQNTYLPTCLSIYLSIIKERINYAHQILLKKLTVPQQVKQFSAFYLIRKFITMFTRTSRCSLSWARWIHSTPFQTTPIFILIFSNYLRLGLSSCLLLSNFPTKHPVCISLHPDTCTCPAHRILFYTIVLMNDVCT